MSFILCICLRAIHNWSQHTTLIDNQLKESTLPCYYNGISAMTCSNAFYYAYLHHHLIIHWKYCVTCYITIAQPRIDVVGNSLIIHFMWFIEAHVIKNIYWIAHVFHLNASTFCCQTNCSSRAIIFPFHRFSTSLPLHCANWNGKKVLYRQWVVCAHWAVRDISNETWHFADSRDFR